MNLSRIKSFVEARPRLWALAWRLHHILPFLLPHDPTYYALKYFSREGGGLILDIGANQGISALSFLKLCPTYQIISIEPNRAHEANLTKIKKKHKNFDYMVLGLANQVGELTLHTPVYGRVPLHTFASLDREHAQNMLNRTYKDNVLKDITIETNTCDVKRLDDLKLMPSIMKIDAEGFELEIMKGGMDTISKCRPQIIFEACNDDILPIAKLLEQFDYVLTRYIPDEDVFVLYDVDNAKYVSGMRNVIAVRKEDVSGLPFRGEK